MNKNFLSVLILISGILISSVIIGSANAQTELLLQPQEQKMPGDIQYPIPELGNCKSKSDCKMFCDNSKNSEACLTFAEKRNLMSPEELANAKKFKDSGMVGPGGCKGKVACDQYCGNSANLEECVTFAQKNGMMSQVQLEESEKVLAAIKRGIKPPACNGPTECNKYCSSSAHMEECINFSIEAGIMDKGKQEESKKVLAAIKRGIKPPACNGPEECDAYCGASEHMEECINFGIETGMMPKQEQEQAQKMLSAIKQGIKPPACKPTPPPNQSEQTQSDRINKPSRGEQEGLQACDQYCADSSHVEECVKFSVAMGNMTEEQAQSSIKNGGKGPGGCIGKDACNAFCDNPDNEETCFNFGKDNGMIPKEDLQRMQEGQQKMKEAFSQIPQEVLDCITTSSGADVVEKMKNGSVTPRKAGDSINQCFQKFSTTERPPGQDLPGGDQQMNQNQSGQNNQQNQPGDKFQPRPGTENPGGQQMPQQAGPGGCKGPEECQKYCISNPEVCKNFQPQQQNQPRQPGQPGEQQPNQPNQPNQPGQNDPNQPGQNQPGRLFREKIEPNQIESSNQPGWVIKGEPNQPMQFNQPNQPVQFIRGEPNQPGQPNQINQPSQQPGQFIQIEPGQPNQPGQIEPRQQPQPQFQPQPPVQQQNPLPPSPISFLQEAQWFLANVLSAFK